MDEIKVKLEVAALKHGKAFLAEAMVECAFPALEKAVLDSESKIDDVVLATLEAPLKAALLDMLAKVGA